MGEWRADQSKHERRYQWGTVRGTKDPVWKDFAQRLKKIPELQKFYHEKIGAEVHFWRQTKDPNGKTFWHSFLRFVGDGWGHWSVWWRPDERRWHPTSIEELPVGRALLAAREFYISKQDEFL